MGEMREMRSRGHFEGNAFPIVEKLPEHTETAFRLLKCLRTHYGRHCEPFSCDKLQDFAHTISKFLPGRVILPDLHRNAPGAWTQTSISAWLASVPIVPVLRNDH